MNLPAHLQNRENRHLAERGMSGLGGLMPPHISIQGNSFTLIDASGNEQSAGATLDCVIADVSDVNCKRYYDKPWEPGSTEPPACFSANGVAPSREASKPQSRTCAECQWNVRGSAISKMSGAAIKACRDEKWLAVLIPTIPDMLFQLIVTPGSFDNWKSYLKKFENTGMGLDFVVTRLTFVPKVNGVIAFEAPGFVDAPTTARIDAALGEKKTDALVGRNDVPIAHGAITGPTQPAADAAPPASQIQATALQQGNALSPASFGQAVNEPGPPATRKRRNTAPAEQPQVTETAPFRPAEPAQPTPFGVGQAVAPNAELEGALKSVFG
jgi:hypothetical protein